MNTTRQKQLDFSGLNIKNPLDLKNIDPTVLLSLLAAYIVILIPIGLVSLDLMVGFMLLSLVAAAITGVVVAGKFDREKTARLEAFAANNNFTYASTGDFASSGTLFVHGHDKNILNVIAGQVGGLPFRFFTYCYAQGNGKNRRDYDASVMEITLPHKMPHMVIDSLVEAGDLESSTLPINFSAAQRIDLEGDFYKYFALYAPDSYGIDALTILAPDVMEILMRFAARCDIEIIDKSLYFYWPDTEISKASLSSKFQTVDAVLDQINTKLTRSNALAQASASKLNSTPGKSVYLKKKRWQRWWIPAFFVLWIINLMNIMLPDNPVPDLVTPALFIIFAAIVYRYYKRERLKQTLKERVSKLKG